MDAMQAGARADLAAEAHAESWSVCASEPMRTLALMKRQREAPAPRGATLRAVQMKNTCEARAATGSSES